MPPSLVLKNAKITGDGFPYAAGNFLMAFGHYLFFPCHGHEANETEAGWRRVSFTALRGIVRAPPTPNMEHGTWILGLRLGLRATPPIIVASRPLRLGRSHGAAFGGRQQLRSAGPELHTQQ